MPNFRNIQGVSDEQTVRGAILAPQTDVVRQYAELFQTAVKAVTQAGWGVPKTHDDLISALQDMAIPTTNISW